jgi:hypothetical protein
MSSDISDPKHRLDCFIKWATEDGDVDWISFILIDVITLKAVLENEQYRLLQK